MEAGRRLHLIGSIPLDNSEQVFRTLSRRNSTPTSGACPTARPASARAGSTSSARCCSRSSRHGDRSSTVPPYKFIQWDGKVVREVEQLRFKPGTDPATVVFETGYDKAALASWDVFSQLRAAGAIAPRTRFQVSLPTPHASGYLYVSGPARRSYFDVYERALKAALGNIARAIPAGDLAIPWDVCQEVLAFEDYFRTDRPADYKKQTFDMLGRLGDAVPVGVEMGFHLCYGSPRDEHLVQPRDAAILVEMLNGIAVRPPGAASTSCISPVPKGRTDAAYYAPLANWKQPAGTTLYLGLLHFDDPAGDKARIAMARRHAADFGFSAECGWGRTEPGRLPGLLKGHRAAAEAF